MDNETGPEAWVLQIERAKNGYIIYGKDDQTGFPVASVIEDNETDELKSHEALLWEIMDYFSFRGSKHDPCRLRVIRESKEDGVPLPDDGKNWEG